MNQKALKTEIDGLDLFEGDTVSGVVVSKADFGAFVDIGAKNSGLLHRNQLRGNNCHLRNERLASIEIGDQVIVDLVRVEQDGERMELSERAVHDDLILSLLPRNEAIEGVVSKVEPYGAFVLLPGYNASGLLSSSRSFKSRKERNCYLSSLAVGDRVTVFVDYVVCKDNLKIALSSRAGVR